MRRHTMRHKAGQHLPQAGVSLARRVGESTGPFDSVITSTLPGAYETAIAISFAVDQQDEQLAAIDDLVVQEVAWDAGFAAWSIA